MHRDRREVDSSEFFGIVGVDVEQPISVMGTGDDQVTGGVDVQRRGTGDWNIEYAADLLRSGVDGDDMRGRAGVVGDRRVADRHEHCATGVDRNSSGMIADIDSVGGWCFSGGDYVEDSEHTTRNHMNPAAGVDRDGAGPAVNPDRTVHLDRVRTDDRNGPRPIVGHVYRAVHVARHRPRTRITADRDRAHHPIGVLVDLRHCTRRPVRHEYRVLGGQKFVRAFSHRDRHARGDIRGSFCRGTLRFTSDHFDGCRFHRAAGGLGRNLGFDHRRAIEVCGRVFTVDAPGIARQV